MICDVLMMFYLWGGKEVIESKPPSRDYLVMIVQIYNRGEIILRARLTLDGSYLPSLRQVGRLNAAFERSIWGKWSERARTETEKLTDNREIQPQRVYLLIPCNFACPRRILGLHSRVKFTKSFANSKGHSFCVPYWASLYCQPSENSLTISAINSDSIERPDRKSVFRINWKLKENKSFLRN